MLRIVGIFKKCATFATANEKRLVPWMSGLVSGLQNRVRRFESARNLQKKLRNHKTGFGAFSFYLLNLNLLFTLNYADRIP